MHVISHDSRGIITIGRGHGNELRLNDISVSRTHAELRVVGNDIYLLDSNSKFGTLVLAKKPLPIKSQQVLNVQAGRTKLSFFLKQPSCTCCREYIGNNIICIEPSLKSNIFRPR